MKYETIPIEVEAHQQQLVSANVSLGDTAFMTANPGDWIVKWPDGRLEVFKDDAFLKKFRIPPPCVGIRQILDGDQPWRRTPPFDKPFITYTDPVMPVGPTCKAH